jgi:hypothetical protein
MRKELESIFKNNEFGQLRTFVDLEGKPWIAGVDVARALGFQNPSNAVKAHCRPHKTIKHRMNNRLSNGSYEITFIEESNFYRLVIKSTLPSAEKFQDWVVEDVLPSLRETGKYEIKEEVSEEEKLEAIKKVTKEDSQVSYLIKLLEEKDQELIKAKQAASLSNSGLIGFMMFSAKMGYRPDTLRRMLEDRNFDLDKYAYRRDDLGEVFLDNYTAREIVESIGRSVSDFIKNNPEYKRPEDETLAKFMIAPLDPLPF